jgi:pimeloyl-ACP methyl ester carboxylesterase
MLWLASLIFCWPFLIHASDVSNNPCLEKKHGTLQPWQIIPPTPHLPRSNHSGYVNIHGVKIWYAEFGKGPPVILLHGGLTNSNYWGKLIPKLAKQHRVIVMDSRNHGRSSSDNQPLSYHVMATDVLALMDFLNVKKPCIIGWSDGANIGLELAIHHPERLSKLFALAANSTPDSTMDVSQCPAFDAFTKRIEKEYMALSPTPTLFNYAVLNKKIADMWTTQPFFTTQDLKSITAPVWIVSGDYDEAIKRSDTEYMARTIPDATLVILPNVGHFAFLQNSNQFKSTLQFFLRQS